jgi:hypothetical protein
MLQGFRVFTVPDEYAEDKKLELMLKELSSLFFRVCKFYTNGSSDYHIKVKNLSFLMTQQPERKWIKCEVNVDSEKFKLVFRANKDGFVYKDCIAYLDEKECTQEDIVSFVEKTNLLDLLRAKIANVKASFIIGTV